MTADNLIADGFDVWLKFNVRSKNELLKRLPTEYGVYVVRLCRILPRVRGESDIIYVGSACNHNGIRGRIRQYFSPGPTQITKRILALVGDSEDYELGWRKLDLKSEAVALEQRLLERFWREHGERPPQNKKG